MVFDRLDVLHRQAPQVFRSLVRLFPYVLDRMRSGGEFCHIVIAGTEPAFVTAVLRELDAANKELEAAAAGGYVRDPAPAAIVDHSAGLLP